MKRDDEREREKECGGRGVKQTQIKRLILS